MVRGDCLCGRVAYEADGPFRNMMSCHCSMCRKHHGTAFATFVGAPLTSFRWLSGERSIQSYQSSPNGKRSFCATCGSVTPMLFEQNNLALFPAGNLSGDLGVKPEAHLFVGSKAPWYTITDSLPQHAEYPPEFAVASVPRPTVTAKPGVTPGSCLCGDVAFETEGTPQRFALCHCSRCRRGRSAAHGANTFVKSEQFRWIRGESQVVSYQVPEAERFMVAFCRRCGGAAPRVAGPMAVVPAGTYDADPGMRPQFHIFTASKASWFEITDEIPQYPEAPPA
ncbi:MAG TPA: GFA family protein [Steroidobacteraceae bacterium]|nr:GFA family protein [Steroidobacteraceae bacterium]